MKYREKQAKIIISILISYLFISTSVLEVVSDTVKESKLESFQCNIDEFI